MLPLCLRDSLKLRHNEWILFHVHFWNLQISNELLNLKQCAPHPMNERTE